MTRVGGVIKGPVWDAGSIPRSRVTTRGIVVHDHDRMTPVLTSLLGYALAVSC